VRRTEASPAGRLLRPDTVHPGTHQRNIDLKFRFKNLASDATKRHIDGRMVMLQILSKRNVVAMVTIALSLLLTTPASAQSAADCGARAEWAECGSSSI
jgi:hypothetical protein